MLTILKRISLFFSFNSSMVFCNFSSFFFLSSLFSISLNFFFSSSSFLISLRFTSSFASNSSYSFLLLGFALALVLFQESLDFVLDFVLADSLVDFPVEEQIESYFQGLLILFQ